MMAFVLGKRKHPLKHGLFVECPQDAQLECHYHTELEYKLSPAEHWHVILATR